MPAAFTEAEAELVRHVAELVGMGPAEKRELLAERKPARLLDVIVELNNRTVGPKGGQLQHLLTELRRIYGLASEATPPVADERRIESPEEAVQVQAELEALLPRLSTTARLKKEAP